MRILVVEDDEAILALLLQQLKSEHYAIDAVKDGLQAWEYVCTYEYSLLILDVVLPNLDGLSLCRNLRQAGYTLPILLLTSQDSDSAKVVGLDAGADDYVVKPFNPLELAARIRALLRRGTLNPLPILTWGDLWLNTNNHEVSYAGTVIELTTTEYALLEMMLQSSQQVLSKEEILDSLWSASEFPTEATIRSHMRRLRHKLISAGAPPDLIATSHGRGYYLKSFTSNSDVLTESASPEPDPAATPPLDLPEQTQEAQYLSFLNQTWQQHRGRCLEMLYQVRAILDQVHSQGRLNRPTQKQAHQIMHTLVGTLGTFGLGLAAQLARELEQEIHPDIYLDVDQAEDLLLLWQDIYGQLNAQVQMPILPVVNSSAQGQLQNSKIQNFPIQATIRVMLLDDDPVLLQTLPRQLQGYGLQVSTLDDPQQFWVLLESVKPDVLILDIQMPDISGLDLCQSLRKFPQWRRLPVMFLTVFGDAQTQNEAFAAGADDYLCKPVNAQDLSNRIQNRLRRIEAFS
jgi:DNA-binding response OmpR family regulator/HPt (histidine-containing phosphotransfer) domain-containing protein